MESGFAATPAPPYYAVIFTTKRTERDRGYQAMAERMLELARTQPGYLGVESVRADSALGITISYWKDEASIRAWKSEADHLAAQHRGKQEWYEHYELRVARVERAYSGPAGR
jgi:heme-degrading monooxygenase HmoA